jgi:ATP adenylyltransferase
MAKQLQFRIASSLTKKPQIPIKDAESRPSTPKTNNGLDGDRPKSPFARDPPDFVIEHVGAKHTLRLNKFCVVRPQLILHTNEFEPQIEPLSAEDLEAAWSVLCRLESPYIVIYNGGMQGGWSLTHRHMHLLPRPPRDEHDLFPDIYGIKDGESSIHIVDFCWILSRAPIENSSCDTGIIPNIPFKHRARRLPRSLQAGELYSIYNDLLAATGVDGPDYSHNLVMVREWMLIIPRLRASQEGVKIVNAAGMMGMIWIPSNDVLDIWLQSGDPMALLARFGKPW